MQCNHELEPPNGLSVWFCILDDGHRGDHRFLLNGVEVTATTLLAAPEVE